METINDSQSKNAAKVAGFAAAIALVGTVCYRGGRFLGRKIKNRQPAAPSA